MKKLFVLISALFIMCTVGFAQTEKTVKSDNKVKIEKAEKALEKNAKAESTESSVKLTPAEKKAADKAKTVATEKKATEKEVKAISTEKSAKPQATEKKAAEKNVKVEAAGKKAAEKEVKTPPTEKKNVEGNVKVGSSEKETGPEITFKETSHDFGNIPYKGNGSYEFVFVNTGTEPLILTQPKSSCGCTVPEWPKQPILPGQSNVVKVTYKNTDRPGNFNKSVTVFSNALINKEVKLHIKGTVEPQPTDAAPLKMESVGTPINIKKN